MPSSLFTPRAQKVWKSLLLFVVIALLLVGHRTFPQHSADAVSRSSSVQQVRTGHGGKWMIPHTWTDNHTSPACTDSSNNITDAAECALRLALLNDAFIDNTQIPLIAHQTSRSADPKTWSAVVLECVEQWLTATTEPPGAEMAWFMWDDEGIDAFISKYESKFHPSFSALPHPVEKADAFRVLVLKWFGGIYGDIDSKPLKHPSRWIQPDDVAEWTDEADNRHAQGKPPQPAYIAPAGAPSSYVATSSTLRAERSKSVNTVNAIFGIEADNPPAPDTTYWRMGYTFPVQLTNWALAMAPHHIIADRFLAGLESKILTDKAILPQVDPLDLTGPPALTRAIKEYVETAEANFSWQSLSSRGDRTSGGHTKIIAGDIAILPITGFSPGRGRFHNMGSEPTTHPSARLQHLAAGSWRKPDLKVEYGKFCRTVFGMCRDWSKFSGT